MRQGALIDRVPCPDVAAPRARDHRAQERCHVLLEDPELCHALPRHLRDRALHDCVAPVMTLPPGLWSVERTPAVLHDGIGLLILEGMLIRRIGVEDRYSAELLGGGDLLRPWQSAVDAVALPLSTTRRVLTKTRIAVLDLAFAAGAAPYPQIATQLIARAMNRSRNLGVLMAIAHQPRVDTRLHALFWHLAGRWGRMRTDGVLLPLRLTHSTLADLVAATRPTVTAALADLSQRGVLTTTADGWRLSGSPPCELDEIAACEPSAA